jgi:hypothetical protein
MKRCTRCGEEKPPTEFSRDRSRKDGRAPWCKTCIRRWQQANAEHMADYHFRWQEANVERKRATNRRYRERKREDPQHRSEDERRTASTARGSEPDSSTRLPRQTTAEPTPSPARPKPRGRFALSFAKTFARKSRPNWRYVVREATGSEAPAMQRGFHSGRHMVARAPRRKRLSG